MGAANPTRVRPAITRSTACDLRTSRHASINRAMFLRGSSVPTNRKYGVSDGACCDGTKLFGSGQRHRDHALRRETESFDRGAAHRFARRDDHGRRCRCAAGSPCGGGCGRPAAASAGRATATDRAASSRWDAAANTEPKNRCRETNPRAGASSPVARPTATTCVPRWFAGPCRYAHAGDRRPGNG